MDHLLYPQTQEEYDLAISLLNAANGTSVKNSPSAFNSYPNPATLTPAPQGTFLSAIRSAIVKFIPVLGFVAPYVFPILVVFLVYLFWDIINGIVYTIYGVFRTGTQILSIIGTVGTCAKTPLVCFYAASSSFGSAHGFKNKPPHSTPNPSNTQRRLIPILNLEKPYKVWSDQLNSDMEELFKVTNTGTLDGEVPSITDLMIYNTRITSAIQIMSNRNSVDLRDKAAAYLIPKLQSLQSTTSDLHRMYESYRRRWADNLTKMAAEYENVANKVDRLRQEWELILDEVVENGNEGKGDGVPQTESILRKVCNEGYKGSLFSFGKVKSKPDLCTYENWLQ